MKNIKYILLAIAFLLLTPACSDYFNNKPESQLLLDDFWKKESDVDAVVRACYRAMQEPDFMWRVMIWGELRSDNVITDPSAAENEKQMNNMNILATNGDCSWTPFYKVINYCNTVLKYAPQVEELDPNFTRADLQAAEAEVLAIRALSYFYLVRTYRDVPLSLEATISDDQPLAIAQSSPEVVLQQITTDLLQAEEWALTSYPTIKYTKGRMTKDAIRAILADVYLWRKEYANCITYCDKLINATTIVSNYSGGTMVVPKYELIKEEPFSLIFDHGNSSESIFELQFSTDVKNDALTRNKTEKDDIHNGLYGSETQIGVLTATNAYADSESELVFPKTDIRKSNFISSLKAEKSTFKIFKYLGSASAKGIEYSYSYKLTSPNWIFYRITDIMLMKAEALVQQNSSEADLKLALNLVNKTYMRANPTLEADSLLFNNYKTVTAMEKLVLLERQRELMFEGKRWFDLVRNAERKNSTAELVDYVMFKYTTNQSTIMSKLSVMNAIYLPIDDDELKVNPLLKQNPYYQVSNTIVK